MGQQKLITLLSLIIVLSGCTTIKTTTTAFYSPSYKASGTIAVVPPKSDSISSLESENYKAQLEVKLASVGYTITDDIRSANHIAIFAYGIDEGREVSFSTPVYGQTGGGTTYSNGTVQTFNNSATYSGTSYTAPTFGVVGTANESAVVYTRIIALDILDPATTAEGSSKKILESRTRSAGVCGSISSVFSEMLEGMFNDFPGKNGKSRSNNIVRAGVSC